MLSSIKTIIPEVEKTVYKPDYILFRYSKTSIILLFLYLMTHYMLRLESFYAIIKDISVYYFYLIPEFVLIALVSVIDNWQKCNYAEGLLIDTIIQSFITWSSVESILAPFYLFYSSLLKSLSLPFLLLKGIFLFFFYNWVNNFLWYYDWKHCKDNIIKGTELPYKENYVDVYYEKVADIIQIPHENNFIDIVPFKANVIDKTGKYNVLTQTEKNLEVLHTFGLDALI